MISYKYLDHSLHDKDLTYHFGTIYSRIYLMYSEYFSIQNWVCSEQFLLLPLRGLNWSPRVRLPSYSSRHLMIYLAFLINLRATLGVLFIYKIIKGDFSVLTSHWNFSIPTRLGETFDPDDDYHGELKELCITTKPFQGKRSELLVTLVHNDHAIPSIEKLNLLILCVSGEARGTVIAYQVT